MYKRQDTGIEQGDEISVYYDPMISKLVSHADDRESAIAKMKQALREYKLIGIKTNIPFLLSLLETEEFINGNYHTQYIENEFLKREKIKAPIHETKLAVISLASILFKENKAPALKLSTSQNGSPKNLWAKRITESFR